MLIINGWICDENGIILKNDLFECRLSNTGCFWTLAFVRNVTAIYVTDMTFIPSNVEGSKIVYATKFCNDFLDWLSKYGIKK
jgi:hypothetical protein